MTAEGVIGERAADLPPFTAGDFARAVAGL
jgi:hypothetical protein